MQLIEATEDINTIKTKYSKICLTNCQMLNLLINDIIDYSQLQSDNNPLKIRISYFSIADLI